MAKGAQHARLPLFRRFIVPDGRRELSWKPHVLARLKAGGCPVCEDSARETKRHFFWFVNEQYCASETVASLRSSYGLCPTHTRHLLETGASSVITTVFSYLTVHALARLQEALAALRQAGSQRDPAGQCRKAARILRPRSACRTCQSLQWWDNFNISTLIQAGHEPEIQEAYRESTGLCLPHFRRAGPLPDWDLLSFLNDNMRQRLAGSRNPEPAYLLKRIAGRNRAPHRRHWNNDSLEPIGAVLRADPRRQPADRRPGQRALSWSPTLDQLLGMLAERGCPACSTCEKGIQDYFYWLAEEMKRSGSSPVHADPSWRVCPAHLWGLFEAGYEPAAALNADRVRREWLSRLDSLAVMLADRPPDRFWDRLVRMSATGCHNVHFSWQEPLSGLHDLRRVVAKDLQSPERRLNDIRTRVFREEHCQACAHAREMSRRVVDLILRVVEDPVGRQAYRHGQGLCLRHCISATEIAEVPGALAELLRTQIARLRLLEWELEETSRKAGWSVRYEPKGPEQSAWHRAAYQFCGSAVADEAANFACL